MGREAKIDIKATTFSEKRKRLAFSTFTPGKIEKLEKYFIRRIKINDGKFYAYFDDAIQDLDIRDSEVETEEENDTVGGLEEEIKEANSKEFISVP